MTKLSSKILLVLSILFVSWLIDVFLLTAVDSLQTDKLVVKPLEKNSLSMDANDLALDLPNEAFIINAITLPPPPISTLDVDVNAAPEYQMTVDAIPMANDSGETEQFTANSAQENPPQINPHDSISAEQTHKTFAQLASLKSQYLTFELPNNTPQRQQFLRHMYQCENMQFGAIVTDVNGQKSLMPLIKKPNQQSSELLRLAHGGLSRDELNRLRAYAPTGTAVRMFPKHIDLQLSRYIKSHLAQTDLTQFSARYSLKPSGLYLVDILVNGHAINSTWQLSNKVC